jgi:hypothetical protein
VPQAVRANRAELGALGRCCDHPSDRARTHAVVRCERSHEHSSVQSASWSPTPQVAGQRDANIGRQRQTLIPARLAVDQDLAGAPVNVINRQRSDLAAPQPKPAHQQHDREIPPADRCLPIATRQQPTQLAALKRLR